MVEQWESKQSSKSDSDAFYPFPHRYAQYSNFKMHGEKDNYKLEIGGYKGNAGDSMNDPWYGSNLSPFSTFDRSVLPSTGQIRNELSKPDADGAKESQRDHRYPNKSKLNILGVAVQRI